MTATFLPGWFRSSMDSIPEFAFASIASCAMAYGSEKSITSARSGVMVIELMTQSALPVCSEGINPSQAVFSMTRS